MTNALRLSLASQSLLLPTAGIALLLNTDCQHMTLTSNQTWARAFATYTRVSQGRPVID